MTDSTNTILQQNITRNLNPNLSQKDLDLQAANNLKRIWLEYKKKHTITQEDFAINRLGWSQGNFSQYLNGQTPIGRKALIKLSSALECKPSDIREEFKDGDILFLRESVSVLLSIIGKHQLSKEDAQVAKRISYSMTNL